MRTARIARRVLIVLLTLTVVIVTLGLSGVAWLRHENRPATGEVPLAGLHGPVQVTRDEWGVPHIRADTDEDAVFALGFVHWQDRSWQMEFQRRIVGGTLAEVLGPGAVEKDRFLRTMGFRRVAEQALPALKPESRQLISAYTAGVNAAMGRTAPAPEFRVLGISPAPWSDIDAVSWSQMMSFDLAGNYVDEIIAARAHARAGQAGIDALYPPAVPGSATILSDEDRARPAAAGTRSDAGADRRDSAAVAAAGAGAVRAAYSLGMAPAPGKGSNNWVVDGSRTRSGAPILSDDPHLGLSSPMLWYLADVRGKDLRAIGASIPGLPAIVIGRTDTFAWGVTNVGADVQDLYVEPKDAPLTSRQEVIAVKGQDDVSVTVRESRHGPIVSDVGVSDAPEVSGPDGQPRTLALRWVALDPGDTTMDAFLDLNYARTVGDAVTALRRYVSPSQNFVLADTEGTIGYYAPGKLPVRSWEGHLPVPGDGSHEWSGYVPFDEVPHVIGPASGAVVSANNDPGPPEASGPRLAGPRVWADPYRAQRILDMLGERTDLDVAAMRAMQMDVRSGPWAELSARLLATTPLDEAGQRALDRLRTWDGVATRDSVETTIFEAWLYRLRGLATDELGEEARSRTRAVGAQLEQGVFCPDAAAGVSTCEQALAHTLRETTDDLRRRLGADMDRWTWGSTHDAVHGHGAFDGIPVLGRIFSSRIPNGGGTDTVAPARPENASLEHRNGASYRQIVDLAEPDASRYVGSLGQGGSPWHPHARDQLPLWRDGADIPMSTREQDWGGTEHLTLTPAG
ncbi:penicillin acylase family protein [Mobilicoccus caccae]|uniref:Penicillin amidase n=1 Tax=Mobilicoccus caccae TaxID=1859295 RepID=A0ABQ6IZZ2_9MICO|nr:penicillin acylase family protein [Mobilicoccus caccae]GMA42273.1 penicillin amidase [Mobilicoccus caccae]